MPRVNSSVRVYTPSVISVPDPHRAFPGAWGRYKSAQERSPSVRMRRNTTEGFGRNDNRRDDEKKILWLPHRVPGDAAAGDGRATSLFLFRPIDGLATGLRCVWCCDRPGGAPLSYFRDVTVYGHGFLTVVTGGCVRGGEGREEKSDDVSYYIKVIVLFETSRIDGNFRRKKHCRRRM